MVQREIKQIWKTEIHPITRRETKVIKQPIIQAYVQRDIQHVKIQVIKPV